MISLSLIKDTLTFSLISFPRLLHIFGDILLLQLAHPLNFVQVDDEAGVVAVMQADAFTAKHSQVVAAVEVLHSLRVLLAQFLLQRVLVFVRTRPTVFLEVEIGLRQDRVLLHYLIENVYVER